MNVENLLIKIIYLMISFAVASLFIYKLAGIKKENCIYIITLGLFIYIFLYTTTSSKLNIQENLEISSPEVIASEDELDLQLCQDVPNLIPSPKLSKIYAPEPNGPLYIAPNTVQAFTATQIKYNGTCTKKPCNLDYRIAFKVDGNYSDGSSLTVNVNSEDYSSPDLLFVFDGPGSIPDNAYAVLQIKNQNEQQWFNSKTEPISLGNKPAYVFFNDFNNSIMGDQAPVPKKSRKCIKNIPKSNKDETSQSTTQPITQQSCPMQSNMMFSCFPSQLLTNFNQLPTQMTQTQPISQTQTPQKIKEEEDIIFSELCPQPKNAPPCPEGTETCNDITGYCYNKSTNHMFTTFFDDKYDYCPETKKGNEFNTPNNYNGMRVWEKKRDLDESCKNIKREEKPKNENNFSIPKKDKNLIEQEEFLNFCPDRNNAPNCPTNYVTCDSMRGYCYDIANDRMLTTYFDSNSGYCPYTNQGNKNNPPINNNGVHLWVLKQGKDETCSNLRTNSKKSSGSIRNDSKIPPLQNIEINITTDGENVSVGKKNKNIISEEMEYTNNFSNDVINTESLLRPLSTFDIDKYLNKNAI